MRKKELLDQSMSLFEQLQKANFEISSLKSDLLTAQNEIKRLSGIIEAQKEKQSVTPPLRRLEDKIITNAVVDREIEYGSSAIGKIVVTATRYSNELTAGGETRYMELVNLILGRTEVAKSEILSAVASDTDFEEKKRVIDEQYAQAAEYFANIMAQRT